jgi:hypothetical protein
MPHLFSLRFGQAFGRAVTYVAIAISAGGCHTTGHDFQADRLSNLVPGQTTLPQATYELAGSPTRLYPQSDGTTLAMWSFQRTLVTDGLYRRKDLILQFGPDGRLLRLVDSTNIALKPEQRQKLLGALPSAGSSH